ncbi:MAG: hypothetical protein ACD_62C00325G0001, partial [uncultured bacterium]
MSGFTTQLNELGPGDVARTVRQFVSEIEYEFAKEGGQIENIIHRAGDEIALSLSYDDFPKMLRATLRAFRRLERRHPDIKIKAGFAACDLMEYPDGIKIGSVSLAQRVQASAGAHGIVVHQNLVERIPPDVEVRPQNGDQTGPEQVIMGMKTDIGFVVAEGFTPLQREADAQKMYTLYHERVALTRQLGMVAYVGGRDTGKAMGLARFLQKLDREEVQILHGAAFRFQRDPVRDALMRHVASYDLDELTPSALDSFLDELKLFEEEDILTPSVTPEALDGFLADIDFFGEDFKHDYTSPQLVVRELLAGYLGCTLTEECPDVAKIKKDVATFITQTHRVVSHVIHRLATRKPLVMVLFNMDFLRKDQDARLLLTRLTQDNRLRPVMVIGLEDTALERSEGKLSVRELKHQYFIGESHVDVRMLMAETLDHQAIEQAIVHYGGKEVSLFSANEPARGSLTVQQDVVGYYHQASGGDLQILRVLLHAHLLNGTLSVNAERVLIFGRARPQQLTNREIEALHLSALDHLSPLERSVFETISVLVGDDVIFYDQELPQHQAGELGPVALARILASLKEGGYITPEGHDGYRIIKVMLRDMVQRQLAHSQQTKARHQQIVDHLSAFERKSARDWALYGYHLRRVGDYQQAFLSYEKAAQGCQKPGSMSLSYAYFVEMEGLLPHFDGADRLERLAGLLAQRLAVRREMLQVDQGSQEWRDDLQTYASLRDDPAFKALPQARQDEVILNGLAIFPGEYWLKQRPNEVAAFYEHVEREQAAFIHSLAPALRILFHIRAMGACQMINSRGQQEAADAHVQKAIALIVGDERATIRDHERVFAATVLTQNPVLFARVCLNIASRYSVHGPQYAVAEPYALMAIELYERMGHHVMTCYARMALGINLNNRGLFARAEEVLQVNYVQGAREPYVRNYALMHLAVSAIKQGHWDSAMTRTHEIDLVYGPLNEDVVAHEAVVLAFQDPQKLEAFLSQRVTTFDQERPIGKSVFKDKSRREAQLFLALFLAQFRLQNWELALRYFHIALEHFDAIGHVEDFNTEFLWLKQHQRRIANALRRGRGVATQWPAPPPFLGHF